MKENVRLETCSFHQPVTTTTDVENHNNNDDHNQNDNCDDYCNDYTNMDTHCWTRVVRCPVTYKQCLTIIIYCQVINMNDNDGASTKVIKYGGVAEQHGEWNITAYNILRENLKKKTFDLVWNNKAIVHACTASLALWDLLCGTVYCTAVITCRLLGVVCHATGSIVLEALT